MVSGSFGFGGSFFHLDVKAQFGQNLPPRDPPQNSVDPNGSCFLKILIFSSPNALIHRVLHKTVLIQPVLALIKVCFLGMLHKTVLIQALACPRQVQKKPILFYFYIFERPPDLDQQFFVEHSLKTKLWINSLVFSVIQHVHGATSVHRLPWAQIASPFLGVTIAT